jgi:hypothetical protein
MTIVPPKSQNPINSTADDDDDVDELNKWNKSTNEMI